MEASHNALSHRLSAVGFNTVRKALKKGNASKVFLANDADEHIKYDITEKAALSKVTVNLEYTMDQLGDLCGIEVPCSVCCVLKDGK